MRALSDPTRLAVSGRHHLLFGLATVVGLVVPSPGDAQEHDHPADQELVGQVSLPTTCSADVQADFDRAVAMLHSFWFEQAEQTFREVAEADPSCAMAHWGVAMTLWGNPMTRAAPPAEREEAALEAVRLARDLVGEASHREQMYVDAAAALYEGRDVRPHLERMRAHQESLQALVQAHGDDPEARIFLGRIMVANAPPDDLTFANQLRATELMEPLFTDMPNHPGLAHYIIHAFDAPALAEHGLDAARRYAAIAPDAPHALHMPSHIFTRLGYWEESIETNKRSAAAEPNPDAAVHPMDYMIYAYLQLGRDSEALKIVNMARAVPDRFYGGLLGYNFAAMRARFVLERSAWRDAADVSLPKGALPHVEAIARFTRAVGAARAGLGERAGEELAALSALVETLRDSGDSYWATVVEAQRLAAAAWAERAAGGTDVALQLAAQAADLEATVEKHPVTPGPLLPARELLGDLLMELGRYTEAVAAYEQTLAKEPKRARALFGAARAAELGELAEVATEHYTALAELMATGDPGRPELMAAKRFLRGR